MQKGRKENEGRSFLMAERDSLPSCSLNMHDCASRISEPKMKATGYRMCIINNYSTRARWI